jgi:hypothetical protein
MRTTNQTYENEDNYIMQHLFVTNVVTQYKVNITLLFLENNPCKPSSSKGGLK